MWLVLVIAFFLLEKAIEIEENGREKRCSCNYMEAIEALRHIYKDGCKTIRPRDKWIIASQSPPLLPSSRRHRHKENKIATNSLIQWANIEDNSPKEPNASSTLKEKGVSEIDVGDLTINKSRKTNKFLDEPEDSNIKAV
ncbi:hypothetical protein V6N13_122184 [Hibiscus sabdariffa]